ncbi:hypothetical protein [uncultured Corynebacterium sp.]|uniref:hypothetical protein n=1 Tax=uncultured Corynebacterium sp. TaxID=159447 RepID=UPI0025FE3DD1|nr:hypothetical protein [uncultured Corynebacterium sp.]
MFSRSRSPLVLIASSTALTAALAVGVPALTAPAPAAAAPSIPDNLPVFPQVQENPSITVTFEDGTPAEGATVHRGDVLLVHGSGFSPQANKGGFPLPVPPARQMASSFFTVGSPISGSPVKTPIPLPASIPTIGWRGSCLKGHSTRFRSSLLICTVQSLARPNQ